MKGRPTNDVVRGLLWWLPGCLIFFRASFTSGFDKITGTNGDARLIVFVQEHWVQVLRGEVSWTSPEVFFPTKGVLGYGDAFLLDEIFYLPLRALGMDPFLAHQWTLILLSGVGFVSLFVFLRKVFALGAPTCAALATTFAFANNLYVKSVHAQLYSLYWVPVVMLLILQAVRTSNQRVRLACGWAAGTLMGLLYFTSFYIGWYATFAAMCVGGIVLLWRLRTHGFKAVRVTVAPFLPATISAVVGFGVAMIPFATIYAPVARSFPDRPYSEAMSYAAWPSDVVNLGSSNFMWGSALRSGLRFNRLHNIEVTLALTPILLLAAVVGCVVILRRRRSAAVGFAGEAAIACCVTLAAVLLLPMKFGGKSLWLIAYTFIPGARSLRAIDRIVLIGGLLAIMIIANALRSLRSREPGDGRPARAQALGIAALLGVIVFEQFNVGNSAQVDRSEQVKALVVAPAPPDECRAFYITDSGPEATVAFISSVDAMLLAQHFQLPTINGYSGQFPRGYHFYEPTADDYIKYVELWAERFEVTDGLCSYDRITHEWTGPEA